jgi:hypothetical protein
VEKFERAAVKKLEERGASLQAGESDAAPLFRDPDGILVQVAVKRA